MDFFKVDFQVKKVSEGFVRTLPRTLKVQKSHKSGAKVPMHTPSTHRYHTRCKLLPPDSGNGNDNDAASTSTSTSIINKWIVLSVILKEDIYNKDKWMVLFVMLKGRYCCLY